MYSEGLKFQIGKADLIKTFNSNLNIQFSQCVQELTVASWMFAFHYFAYQLLAGLSRPLFQVVTESMMYAESVLCEGGVSLINTFAQ